MTKSQLRHDVLSPGRGMSVNCPATVPVKPGTTVTCPVTTASGRQATVSFEFSDSSGTVDSSSVEES